MQRWLALVVVAAVACGGQRPDVNVRKSEAVAQSVTGSGQASAAISPPPEPVKIGCPQPSCVYHAGANGYFTCFASGNGVCFHYGAPCTPADGCMVDAAERKYKQCANVEEGMCSQWGATCSPRSACMFRFEDSLHRHCDEMANGTCKHYGELCAP